MKKLTAILTMVLASAIFSSNSFAKAPTEAELKKMAQEANNPKIFTFNPYAANAIGTNTDEYDFGMQIFKDRGRKRTEYGKGLIGDEQGFVNKPVVAIDYSTKVGKRFPGEVMKFNGYMFAVGEVMEPVTYKQFKRAFENAEELQKIYNSKIELINPNYKSATIDKDAERLVSYIKKSKDKIYFDTMSNPENGTTTGDELNRLFRENEKYDKDNYKAGEYPRGSFTSNYDIILTYLFQNGIYKITDGEVIENGRSDAIYPYGIIATVGVEIPYLQELIYVMESKTSVMNPGDGHKHLKYKFYNARDYESKKKVKAREEAKQKEIDKNYIDAASIGYLTGEDEE